MKVESYEILDNRITLNFNKMFKQIKYLKFSCNSFIDKCGELDCDETEIKFTKQKSSINIFEYNENNLIIFLIKEVDNNPLNYSYYIRNEGSEQLQLSQTKNDNEQSMDNEQNMDLLGLGISKLLLGGFSENVVESDINIQNSQIWQCSIKNRNIFANIKKKVNKYGNAKIN